LGGAKGKFGIGTVILFDLGYGGEIRNRNSRLKRFGVRRGNSDSQLNFLFLGCEGEIGNQNSEHSSLNRKFGIEEEFRTGTWDLGHFERGGN
jgi:hypothetical protein